MTWLEVLLKDPFNFLDFACEHVRRCNDSSADCIDSYIVFRRLGLVRTLSDCPSALFYDKDTCLDCVFNFLTDPEIYKLTTKGDCFDD